jgi:hypothetical protein
MYNIIEFFKSRFDHLKGWLEVISYKNSDYKYVIENISNNYEETKFPIMIRYKVAGSRVLVTESAANLNKSSLFCSFKPEHAQMIVSIATVEAMLRLSSEEIESKYLAYVRLCSLKINERKRS